MRAHRPAAVLRALRARANPLANDEGSVLPLIIGMGLVAASFTIVIVDISDLHLARQRAAALADAAAVAGADAFGFDVGTDGTPAVQLHDDGVRTQAQDLVDHAPEPAELVRARAIDSRTAEVTVQLTWHPPIISVFVPGGIPVTATGVSRAVLR